MPGCVYVHPWELDPAQPRQPLGGLRGFRHYVNLARTSGKLARILSRHRFVGVAEALAQVPALRTIPLTSLLGPARP